VEFNARFGDPETEVILPLLESNLLDVMLAVARGDSIEGAELRSSKNAALTTILAAQGYPGTPLKGQPITIPDSVASATDVIVFHAGTKAEGNRVVTSGGRVLAVTAIAPRLPQAAERSRAAAAAIQFEGRQYRRDIGWREIARLTAPAPGH
jgi:phosphoribosylamine---glycine ligase